MTEDEEEETDFLLWLSSRLLKNMLAIKVYSATEKPELHF